MDDSVVELCQMRCFVKLLGQNNCMVYYMSAIGILPMRQAIEGCFSLSSGVSAANLSLIRCSLVSLRGFSCHSFAFTRTFLLWGSCLSLAVWAACLAWSLSFCFLNLSLLCSAVSAARRALSLSFLHCRQSSCSYADLGAFLGLLLLAMFKISYGLQNAESIRAHKLDFTLTMSIFCPHRYWMCAMFWVKRVLTCIYGTTYDR